MKITKLLFAASILAIPALAMAGDNEPPVGLPEPETLALLAIGAIALTIARWRKKQ